MIDSIRDQHHNLHQRVDKSPSEALLQDIKQFISECIQAGKNLSNIDDRSELRSILHDWGNFVFQKTGDTSYLMVQIQDPILGLTHLRLTFDELILNCQKRADWFVSERVREGVFEPQKAIHRKQVENQFWDFLWSDRTGLVVTGNSGIGKTFLICQLAEQKPWRTDKEIAIILPYDCQELSIAISPLDHELGDAIEHQIACSLGLEGLPSPLEMESNYLDELLKHHDAYLLVCFDTVERFIVNLIEKSNGKLQEVSMARELLLSLNNIIKTFALRGVTRIKFLLTCGNSTWASLGPERLMAWNLYFASHEETKSLTIEKFNESELKKALEAYDVSAEARELIPCITEGNPYMLRLASDLISRLGNAKKVTEDLVFREFYSKRVLRSTKQEQIQKQHFLMEFAKKAKKFLREGQNSDWGITSEDINPDDPVYKLLELDGVISEEKIKEPFPQIVIFLNPPILAQYIKKWYGTVKTP